MIRVAVLDDYQQVALRSADWDVLGAAAADRPDGERCEVTVFPDHVTDPDTLARRLAGFAVVVAMRERTPLDASLLRRLPDLRLIVTTGMTNAAIDVAAAGERGIVVCGTGGSAHAAPELTWALLMALVRRVPIEDANVRTGRWQTTVGVELAGRTLGLLGLGRIGQAVAGYARAFGMTVAAWSEHLSDDVAAEHGARRVGFDELFAVSDVVAITTRLSDRTRGIVGAAQLRALGPNGFLVNTSRGPIVDEAALVAALHAGTIAGAGLDVFDVEPLPVGHPLRTAPGTVLTPHVGYVTAESYTRYFADAVEDIAAWLAGTPIRVVEP